MLKDFNNCLEDEPMVAHLLSMNFFHLRQYITKLEIRLKQSGSFSMAALTHNHPPCQIGFTRTNSSIH